MSATSIQKISTPDDEQQEISILAEVEDELEPMPFEVDDISIPGLEYYLSSESGGPLPLFIWILVR